jgi:YteA family regulatory protein
LLDNNEVDKLHTMLVNMKDELESRSYLEERSQQASVGELSSYDNHPADLGTEEFERGKDLSLKQHSSIMLEKVNKALQAIDEGAYGVCLVCKKNIDPERLEAVPYTLYCKEHSPDQKISDDRPIEEDVLGIPFSTMEYDDRDATFFDAEDSWQDVAQYGTSNTPGDFFQHDLEEYSDTYIDAHEGTGYVEAFENFIGTDIYGNNITVYPSKGHEQYERDLDNYDEDLYLGNDNNI